MFKFCKGEADDKTIPRTIDNNVILLKFEYFCRKTLNFNPSVTKGIGTHIGYQGGEGVKFIKYLLFCHHGNHLITRCSS